MALKKKSQSDIEWLAEQPLDSEIEASPFGGKHLPIGKLRPLLDVLNGQTKNYKTGIYSNGTMAYGSLELTVTIDGVDRTVTGSSNLVMSEAINNRWNATLKTECVKNAAAELGTRFGRGLNDGLISEDIQVPKPKLKPKPDAKIMQQYLKAVEIGDTETITTLTDIYEIKNN
jgi:hypothetical protein